MSNNQAPRRLVGLSLAGLLGLSAACGSAAGSPGPAVPPAVNVGNSSPAASLADTAASGAHAAVVVAPTRVRASYSVLSGSVGPYWMAEAAGLWQQHGLDVELSQIAGAPTSMAAL